MRLSRGLGAALCLFLACNSRSQTQSPRSAFRGTSFTAPSSPLALAAIEASRAKTVAVPNFITVENQAAEQRNRPLTVSRSFAQGEIPRCPQAVLGGNPLETQCDVKTRWPDGSVRHVLVTFFADLPAKKSIKVDFRDQAPPATTGLTKEEMLSFQNGNWGAALRVRADGEDAGNPVVRDAKEILRAWNGKPGDLGVRYWLSGPLVTQVIVEDKGSSRFDLGWSQSAKAAILGDTLGPASRELRIRQGTENAAAEWRVPGLVYVGNEILEVCEFAGDRFRICPQGRAKQGTRMYEQRPGETMAPAGDWKAATEVKYKSLHPIFVLTFYRGWTGVKVEYILENTYAMRQQTQVYHAQLLRGRDLKEASPERWLVHWPGSRWRQVVWNGSEPSPIHVDHNIPYLVYSHALPSYDISRRVPEAALRQEYAAFQASDRGEVMGRAQWLAAFEAPGGRGDIALLPRWYVRYVFSSDPRLWEVLYGNAAVSAHIPIHYRESEPGRPYCPFSCKEPPTAQGRVLSIEARPTGFPPLSGDSTLEDTLARVGNANWGGWTPDIAHQAEFAFLPYLLTGEWYFLEELQFWASWNGAVGGNPGVDCDYCRHRDWGYVTGEIRSRAWGMRTVGLAALMSPDATAEKTYFTDKLNNMIAGDEGFFDIRNGSFYEPCPAGPYDPARTTRWCWGNRTMAVPERTGGANPLYSYERINSPDYGISSIYGQQDFPKNPPSTKLSKPWAKPAYSLSAEWGHHFHTVVSGALLDLGFTQIAELHARKATRLLQQLKSPRFNPYLVAAYRTPEFACVPKLDTKQNRYICTPGGRYSDWGDILNGFKEREDTPADTFLWRSMDQFYDRYVEDAEGGYTYYARAAATFLPGLTFEGLSGKEAWDWIAPRAVRGDRLNDTPMWAFLPRSENYYGMSAPAASPQKEGK